MSNLYENTPIRKRAEMYVKNEVIHRANELIDHLSKSDDYMVMDFYTYDYDSAAMDWLNGLSDDDKTEYLADNEMTTDELTAWVLENSEMVCYDENLDADIIEILEYWVVSDWLANQLIKQGEIVVEILGFNIWGRTTSGQHISLDHVMLTIANNSK